MLTVSMLQKIHHWQNLSVIRHQCLRNARTLKCQKLDFAQNFHNHIFLFCLKCVFDWQDKLRKDWQYFFTSFSDKIITALIGQKSAWIVLLSEAFKEDWEVVVVV